MNSTKSVKGTLLHDSPQLAPAKFAERSRKSLLTHLTYLTFLTHLTLATLATAAAPMGTAFTYQGRLSANGNPANGTYDFQFTLFDDVSGGSQVSPTVTNLAVNISGGIFTTLVDFGSLPTTGQQLWLQIGSRTNKSAPNPPLAFTPLSPRQPLTAAPYALTAGSLSGALPSTQLKGTYTDAVALNNPANSINGHGEGLQGVNASTLNGKAASKLWQLGGNSGTQAGSDFLGTTDNQPLELKVKGQRALRVEPTLGTPNMIGGWSGNSAGAGVIGAAIGGGGIDHEDILFSLSYYSSITLSLSNSPNLVLADGGTVAGGFGNTVLGTAASIGGGALNLIGTQYYPTQKGATIGGGIFNEIAGGAPGFSADLSTIAGGFDNFISGSGRATISGGDGNSVVYQSLAGTIGGGSTNKLDSSVGSTIGGGQFNSIVWNSSYSTVGGGIGNTLGENLGAGTTYSTIGGGQSNKISHLSTGATIGGGARNNIARGGFPFAEGGTISGGADNNIFSGAAGAVVAGGARNSVQSQSQFATIGGGTSNSVSQNFATIPGGAQASASNYGQMAYASGQFAAPGDAQSSLYVCRGATTNSTPTELFLDGAAMRMNIPVNSTWGFDILVTGRAADGKSAVYHVTGAIQNGAGVTSFIGSPLRDKFENVSAWNATAVADNTNGALTVQVTGADGASIRWVASVRTVEVSY